MRPSRLTQFAICFIVCGGGLQTRFLHSLADVGSAYRKGKRAWKRAFSLFVKAFLIGAVLAATVGPITILYLRRAMTEGWRSGFSTVLGAVTADAIYASIAAFGLSALSGFLISIQTPVRLIGGLFLLYIGYKTFRAVPGEHAATVGGNGLWGKYVSTFLLTMTNPMTIILFAGIFTGSGLALTTEGENCAPALVLGVAGGSLACATLLVTLGAFLRTRITPTMMLWINRAAGIAICGFAVITLWGLVAA